MQKQNNQSDKPNWGNPPAPHATYSLLPTWVTKPLQNLIRAISEPLRLSGFRIRDITSRTLNQESMFAVELNKQGQKALEEEQIKGIRKDFEEILKIGYEKEQDINEIRREVINFLDSCEIQDIRVSSS